MAKDKAERLPFNPAVLRWARERLGLTVEEAASSADVRPERLTSWEEGERVPTVPQARRLAETYDRPFLEFFAAELPYVPDIELVPDFRLHRGAPSGAETAALKAIQRWAEEQRLNALSLLEELEEPAPEFPASLSFTVRDDFEAAADQARRELEFSIEAQLKLNAAERLRLPEIIRSKLETRGILVLKHGGLSKLHARGVCLYANPLPTIVFGNEAPGAQAFTLAHELGHILLKASGISGQPEFNAKDKRRSKTIEEWCNEFAAAFLIPRSALNQISPKPNSPRESFDNERLTTIARLFSVSRHAMLIRLVELGHVASDFYWQVMRPIFLKEEEEYKPGFARSPYYGVRYVNSRGRFYTGLVLEAWQSGRISGHNAAEYMGIKNLAHLRDIRERFVV